MKLSFSIPSNKSSSSSSRRSATKTPQVFHQGDGAGGGGAIADSAKPEFVTEFIPSKPLTPDAPSKHVIAPIPDSHLLLRSTKKAKSLSLPDPLSDDPSRSHTHFVLHPSAADPAASAIPYGLTLRPNLPSAGASEGEEPGRPSSEDLVLRRYKEDMESLPDDRGFEEFADVAVEDFGAALLAGYGWSEGKGIGRKAREDTKVIQYDRRAGTEGLGYVPDPAHAAKRKIRRAPPTADEVKQTRELEFRSKDNKRESSREERRSRDSGRDGKRSNHERESRDNDTHHHRSSSGSRGREREREKGPVQWLTSHIKVRIISKDFEGERLYLKKGKVVNVVGPTTCDILMDESGELLQSVDQKILETALPKRGGSVLVLYGRHKGVYGNLVERDAEEGTGVVRDADSHALVNVRLEQIAEYIGDPSYVGY